ncbi:peptide ABC transporter substrate-binding protein [Breoghania sp.]|uniref:peptide ABC transporter substrate-binding protein n=1 Tax=Breoghania sp. TaxID=2065378 RepID=UPI002AA89573|nr:peptide ABC transporter substrate-binding protein [Breoghania sp.]
MGLGLGRAAAVALMVLVGVTSASAEVVYRRGNDANPETLDQHKTSTIAEATILGDLYEGLLIHDTSARVVPGMAESWEISPDNTRYTFHLRKAKWSNGDPITADDFVYSLRRIMTPATGAKYANILYPVKNGEAIHKGEADPETLGVRALDPETLEITLERPTPYFLELLSHQTGLPVHKASVEKFGADFVKPGNMVTNGAYTLVDFTPDEKVELAKSPTYYDAANVQIDRVIYYPMEDRSACVRRYEAGEIDSCSDLPTDQMASLREKFGDQVRTPPYLGTYYYAVHTDKPPFDDVRVRRALSMAIDRVYLADEIWAGTMLPAYAFVPPGIESYGEPSTAGFKDEPMLDREDEALRLLEEAGFGLDNPLKLEIAFNTSENHRNTAVAIADMWKAVGVEAKLLNRDGSSHYAYLREKGDFDVARAAWIGDYSDAQNFLFMVRSDNSGFNYANYANPEYDGLLDKAAAELDPEKRSALLHEAEAIFMRDVPFIPLMYYSSHSLVSPRLKGWTDNILNIHLTRFLSLVDAN